MNFIDESKIEISSGAGGSGLVSFRRERGAARGGPSGGDGGSGGNIIFQTDPNLNTLFNFLRLKRFKAEDGKPGKKDKRKGKKGKDLILKIPLGTLVYEIKNQAQKLVADLSKPDQKILAVKGGRGGWGNWHFASATRQTPNFALSGKPAEKKTIFLELKLLADVGITGLPNSGKSTLLKALSAARPKIADYPFTTLAPNLGAVIIGRKSKIFADIPGLISGASSGKGLGDKFLKHIERTRILIYLLDITSSDPSSDFKTLQDELKLFNRKLPQKPEILVLNKIDKLSPKETALKIAKFKKQNPHHKIVSISALKKQNLKTLLFEISKIKSI